MQTTRFLFLAFMDFIATIFIGAVVGLVLAKGIIDIQERERLKSWRLHDSSVKFVEIVDASAYAIVTLSTEGKLYEWNNWDCQLNQICTWKETDEVDIYKDEQTTVVRKDVCQHKGFAQPAHNPGNVIECVFTSQLVAELSPVVYYAILDNGTIWSWPRDGVYGNEYPLFLIKITLMGGVLGIVAGIVVVYQKEKNSKYG